MKGENYDADTQQNEITQSLIETRRQQTALFEQRMQQANQLFADQIATSQSNRAIAESNAASAAATAATNANSQALAQLAVNVKLSGGVYMP
jgi:hypothetical protein